MVEDTDLSTLAERINTNFTLESFMDSAIFNFGKANDIKSKDFHFDFTLNGKLNLDLTPESINVQIPLKQIKNSSVSCTFNILEDKKANLKCNLNLEEYKDKYKEFSLKVTETKSETNPPIYLSRINEIKLIHEDEDDGVQVGVIIGCVVGSVAVVGVGIGIGIYLHKAHKIKKLLKINPNDNSVRRNLHHKVDAQDSHRKIIPFGH